jgi:hypothetical protein
VEICGNLERRCDASRIAQIHVFPYQSACSACAGDYEDPDRTAGDEGEEADDTEGESDTPEA